MRAHTRFSSRTMAPMQWSGLSRPTLPCASGALCGLVLRPQGLTQELAGLLRQGSHGTTGLLRCHRRMFGHPAQPPAQLQELAGLLQLGSHVTTGRSAPPTDLGSAPSQAVTTTAGWPSSAAADNAFPPADGSLVTTGLSRCHRVLS